MARYEIPNTNVSFQSHLRTPFDLGSSNNSLNTVGGRIFPRVTNPTGIGSIRNIVSPNFVYALADIVITDEFGEPGGPGGTVEVTSPMTIAAADGISISPTFVIDSRTYSTITLQCNPAYGYTFLAWRNQDGTLLTTNNPATINLNTANLYDATMIQARVFI
jgi:hypothetical protein